MSEVWSLPGYDVQCLLGFGATGEVWRARELATGETVALKRLKPDVDPTAVQALRWEAELLGGLDTPYVVRLRAVVGTGAEAVLVLDHAAGGSLATLLARRGVLEAGEVVTVAAPLAQALADVHARGIVHGDLTPANVLFTAEGMPLLSDLGLSRRAGEVLESVQGTAEYVDPAVAAGGEPDAASDVWALAAVCHTMLAGAPPHTGGTVLEVLGLAVAGERAPLGLLAPAAPRALVHAVEAGLACEPAERPDAASFASLLRRAHAAAPVQLTGGLPAAGAMPEQRPTHTVRAAAAHAAPGRRWGVSWGVPPRGALLAMAFAALVLLAGAAGWASGRGGEAVTTALAHPVTTPSAPTPVVPSAPDWPAVLDELDAARAAAFAEGDADRLLATYAREAPGLQADRALLAGLVQGGRTAHGVRHEVRSVEELESSATAARLRVVDVLRPYEVHAADGTVLSRAAARAEQVWVVELAWTQSGWRLLQLRAET